MAGNALQYSTINTLRIFPKISVRTYAGSTIWIVYLSHFVSSAWFGMSISIVGKGGQCNANRRRTDTETLNGFISTRSTSERA